MVCVPDKLQVNAMTQIILRGSLQCALPLQSCCEVHLVQLGIFQSCAPDPGDCSVWLPLPADQKAAEHTRSEMGCRPLTQMLHTMQC